MKSLNDISIKVLFKNKKSHFLIISLFGIAAGLLVAFFSIFPSETLWAFAFFSSSTFGFWMFTTSIIVIFSEKGVTSFINPTIYIFLMFFITNIFKRLHDYNRRYTTYNNIFEFLLHTIPKSVVYGLIPGIICGILGIILWNARKNTVFGKVLLAMPAAFIFAEMVIMYIKVFSSNTMLFMALVDTACFLIYIILFGKHIIRKL